MNEKYTKKRLCLFTLVSSTVFAGVYLVLSALYASFGANIVISATAFPITLDFLVELCNISSYAVVFSAFIYSVWSLGTKPSISLLLIYGGVLLIKNLLNVFVQSAIFSIAPSIADLLYVLLIWLLDVLMAAAVLLIANLCLSTRRTETPTFIGIYSPSNALQTSSLLVGVFVSVIRLITRLIYDVGYGAPADLVDLLWMLGAYLSDLLVCGIIYLISSLVVKNLVKNENF